MCKDHLHIYTHVENKYYNSTNLSTFISQIGAAGVHNDRGLPTSARCGCVTLEQAKPELHSNGRERADPPRVSTSYRNPADAWDAQIVKLFRVHQTVKSLCFPTSRKVIGLGRLIQSAVSCDHLSIKDYNLGETSSMFPKMALESARTLPGKLYVQFFNCFSLSTYRQQEREEGML